MTDSSYTEWDLMCISEDIEPGDTVIMENLIDVEIRQPVIYTHISEDDSWFFCEGHMSRKQYTFSTGSLDEKGKRTKQWRIVGKSKLALRFGKEI